MPVSLPGAGRGFTPTIGLKIVQSIQGLLPLVACLFKRARALRCCSSDRLNNQAQLVVVVFHPGQSWTHTMEIDRVRVSQFRGRQAPPKPDIKRVRPGKPPRQIPSFLTMKQAGEQDG